MYTLNFRESEWVLGYAQSQSPKDYHVFKWVPTPKTWADAKAHCQKEHKATLAVFHTKEESVRVGMSLMASKYPTQNGKAIGRDLIHDGYDQWRYKRYTRFCDTGECFRNLYQALVGNWHVLSVANSSVCFI